MSTPLASATQLTVDVISDVVCPWCFVGKRQLEQAMRQFRQAHPDLPEPAVRWHPFQLNPDLPAEGVARDQYLSAKFGTSDTAAIYERVKAAGAEVDLDLKMDKISQQPNTVASHALISMASEGTQDAIVEAFFKAYFHDGRDLTLEETLIELGRDGGIAEPSIEAAIHDEAVHETIRRADSSARSLGVQGVPFFIFNQKIAVNGAAGAQTLMQAAETALARVAEEAAQEAQAEQSPQQP